MPDSGKNIELLVKVVENILLPKGFTVTVREKIFNDKGIQIAELDVLVSGKLGSTQVDWLIECRDRPSEGSSPISWIEQLVGRRDRLGLTKLLLYQRLVSPQKQFDMQVNQELNYVLWMKLARM